MRGAEKPSSFSAAKVGRTKLITCLYRAVHIVTYDMGIAGLT